MYNPGLTLRTSLATMDREEKIKYLAFLKAFTYTNAFRLQKDKTLAGSKRILAGVTKKVAVPLKENWRQGIQKRLDSLDFNYAKIEDIMAEEEKKIFSLDGEKLEMEIIGELTRISGYTGSTDNEKNLYRIVVVEAAKHYSLEVEGHCYTQLEGHVFTRFLEQMEERVRKELQDASDDEITEIQSRIDIQLKKMGEAEREALRRELDLEEVSSAALMGLFKRQGVTLISLYAAGSAGIGVFLAVTTMVHAVFTTILGLTLPFVLYTTLASFISFLVFSPLGWLVITGGVGGHFLKKGAQSFNRGVLAVAVAVLISSRLRPQGVRE